MFGLSFQLSLRFLPTLVVIIVCWIHSSDAVCNKYHYNSDDCGITEEIPGDTRTQMPWTAGIFHRPDPDTNYTFHATGTIIGPTTILTVFSGVQEKLPRKIRGKNPTSQNPEDIIIVVGLKSGTLEHADNYTQISDISFIEPYLGSEDPGREYHFVLLHLKTPLDFSTPYVRPICLSYFKLGRKVNETSSTFLHGGFAKRKLKGENETGWEVELKLQLVLTGTGYECVKTYEKYYDKHFPAGMFCSRLPQSITNQTASADPGFFSCLQQGSSIIQKVGQQWYLAGVTALIRGRKGGVCKNDAIYFNSRLSISLEWIERSLRCSPFSFSCTEGTCIPLESVCNSIRNCLDNGLDENEILCETNRKCDSPPSSFMPRQKTNQQHQCNLVGTCIAKEQVCDGFRDCEDGTDESPTLCNKDLTSRSSRDLSPNVIQYCLPLPESEGVQIEYISINQNGKANCTFIPVSTFALTKCRSFYKSKHLYSHLEQQCNDNGKWSEQSKFECEPDCGMANPKSSLTIVQRQSVQTELDLPWHGLIFNLDQPTQKLVFICGASLIHKEYLVTAGHCFDADSSLKSHRIVLSPASKNFSENLHFDKPEIFEIDKVWRPEQFDLITKEADIALIKLKRSVHFGAYIRPACFLHERVDELENNDIDQMPVSPWARKESIAIAGLHMANFPEIVEMACIPKDFVESNNLGFKCVGHKYGVPVKQTDTGGGLISSVKTKYGSRYVLKGIMSSEESFNTEHISQFTSLEKYRDWITEIINR